MTVSRLTTKKQCLYLKFDVLIQNITLQHLLINSSRTECMDSVYLRI